MNLTHLGTATVLIEVGSLRLLTDPAFDPKGTSYRLGLGAWSTKLEETSRPIHELGDIDAVLISHHHHFDNLDYLGRELLQRESVKQVVTINKGAEQFSQSLEIQGKTRGIGVWESHMIQGSDGSEVRITATPALHGKYEEWPGFGRRTIGFILEWSGQRDGVMYVSGDTILFSGMKEIVERTRSLGGIGTALLHAGAVKFAPLFFLGRHTLTARSFVAAAELLDAKRVIPIHYDGWSHFKEGEREIKTALAQAPEIQARVQWLSKGELITI